MALRRSLFGHWSDVGDLAETDPGRTDDEQYTTSNRAKRPNTKGKNIDAKMRRELNEDQRAYDWSAAQWADVLNCSAGTVKGTAVWKEIMKIRLIRRAELEVRQARKQGRPDKD